jgi:putative tricarboxylic transport membrane protein
LTARIGREEIVPPSTSSLREFVRKRDFYAGGLMVLIGLFVAIKGTTYRLGTLMHMGPGFLPTMLGVLLVLLGIAIAATALSPSAQPGNQRILPEHPQWKAWGCILAGPLLFIVLGAKFGMIPGTFACVFVSALGDRTATWKGTVILATVVTAFGVGLFSYLLQVPMPLLTWSSGL